MEWFYMESEPAPLLAVMVGCDWQQLSRAKRFPRAFHWRTFNWRNQGLNLDLLPAKQVLCH